MTSSSRVGYWQRHFEERPKELMGSAFGRITEEQPSYATIRTADEYEIRRYEPCCVIETSYASSAGMVSGDQGTSFMALARYIGVLSEPANERREKIDMTAPVFMTTDGAASDTEAIRYVMRFVLPKSMFADGAKSAPASTQERVRVRDLDARVVAVRRFSGRMREDAVRSHAEILREALRRDGVAFAENAASEYAGYNPPWTPGPFRTNEVMIAVSP